MNAEANALIIACGARADDDVTHVVWDLEHFKPGILTEAGKRLLMRQSTDKYSTTAAVQFINHVNPILPKTGLVRSALWRDQAMPMCHR